MAENHWTTVLRQLRARVAQQAGAWAGDLLPAAADRRDFPAPPGQARVRTTTEALGATGDEDFDAGHSGFHLPSRIRWHQVNARMNAEGVMYINVPFRFYAPGGGGRRRDPGRKVLSRRAYDLAKTLGARESLDDRAHPGTLPPRVGGGTMSAREQAYRARPQLGEPAYVPATRANVRPGVTNRPLIGGLQRTTSMQGRTTYMTWRTIRQDAPNWWIPPRPARHQQDPVERTQPPPLEQALEPVMRRTLDLSTTVLQAWLIGQLQKGQR